MKTKNCNEKHETKHTVKDETKNCCGKGTKKTGTDKEKDCKD